MLKRLTIRNYALIENLDIEFPDGLVIITGETGAGKSIMLGALSLLLGAKADASAIKDVSRNCVVEGEFEQDGEALILRRVVSPQGRTRNFVNDEPVPVARLAEISSRIIDIHAQHQHLLLADADYQMRVLDHYAGTAAELAAYKATYAALQRKEADLAGLESAIARSEGERDYRQFQFDKLEQAALRDGELEELESEQKQLAHAEQIKESIYGALSMLQPMGNSLVQQLKEAAHALSRTAAYVEGLEELCSRLESCRIECQDIEEELDRRGSAVVVSPERLQQVEDRIGVLYGLMNKYAVSTVAELMALKDELEQQLLETDRYAGRKQELEQEVAELRALRERQAAALSAKRKKALKPLSQTLQEKIRDLQMPRAAFEVEMEPLEKFTANGKDGIRFLFTANGDRKLGLLHKSASGGELSRIMLCLKSLMAEYTGMPTMIFDEIDTGVSGSIADKMGKLIGKMGERMQIFAITHLPQIASKKGTHLLVYKEFIPGNGAATHIREISGEERVREVARMLSGSSLTEAAMENARELLKQDNNK